MKRWAAWDRMRAREKGRCARAEDTRGELQAKKAVKWRVEKGGRRRRILPGRPAHEPEASNGARQRPKLPSTANKRVLSRGANTGVLCRDPPLCIPHRVTDTYPRLSYPYPRNRTISRNQRLSSRPMLEGARSETRFSCEVWDPTSFLLFKTHDPPHLRVLRSPTDLCAFDE